MSFKVADLTKNSKWKLTADVPFYEGTMYSWGMHSIKNSTSNAPAGTEFVVPVKRMSGTFNDVVWDSVTRTQIPATWEASGVYFPIILNGKQGVVFFNDIKNCIELVEQPKDTVVLIKDTVTGKYFTNDYVCYVDQYDKDKLKAAEEKYNADVKNTSFFGAQYSQVRHTYDKEVQAAKLGFSAPDIKKSEVVLTFDGREFKFTNLPLSGKVFKNAGFAKQRLLSCVGYFNDTTNDMMYCRDPLTSIPETWKLVEYDRVTKTETVLDFDCTEYARHALELKVLTTKYGSSTRSLYQKLEKKGELDKFKHFIIFTPGNVDQQPLSEYMMDKYDNPLLEEVDRYTVKEIYDGGSYTIKKSEVQMVKDIVDKKMKKVFGYDSICIAIEDRHDAMQIQFTYLGNLNIKMIDMVTLQEIVQEDEVQS